MKKTPVSPNCNQKNHDGWDGRFYFKKRHLRNVEQMAELQVQMKSLMQARSINDTRDSHGLTTPSTIHMAS